MGADSKSTERASEGPASAAPDAEGEVRASGARECGRCAGSGWEGAVVGALICERCSGMGLVWPKPMAGVEAEEPEIDRLNEDAPPVSHAGFMRWMGGGL